MWFHHENCVLHGIHGLPKAILPPKKLHAIIIGVQEWPDSLAPQRSLYQFYLYLFFFFFSLLILWVYYLSLYSRFTCVDVSPSWTPNNPAFVCYTITPDVFAVTVSIIIFIQPPPQFQKSLWNRIFSRQSWSSKKRSISKYRKLKQHASH
jgi:hypothetical protein